MESYRQERLKSKEEEGPGLYAPGLLLTRAFSRFLDLPG
ncbi:hypothetical protein HNQ56_002107 [Anaerotaenia torta]